MEFGRVDPRDIPSLDFSLAPDGKSVARTLPGVPAPGGCKFHVGCAKWGRKEWKGHLYGDNLKEQDFLEAYAEHFDVIELNATFYSIPSPDQITKWRKIVKQQGNKDFLFVPRVSRTITHISRLNNTQEELSRYLTAIAEFKTYLGPVFFQLSDNFGPKNYFVLAKFIQELPEGFQYFLELRHPEWFSDVRERERVFTLFAKHNIGSSVSDASGRRDCVHMELPTRELFVRFVGTGGEYQASDYARVDEWVERIEHWVARGLEKVWFFAHQHDESSTPQLAGYIIDQFNKRFGAGLKPVEWKA